MTTKYKKLGVEMSRCRRCDHDLYIIKQGKDAGQARCSNPSCKYAASQYEMGKEVNWGVGRAA